MAVQLPVDFTRELALNRIITLLSLFVLVTSFALAQSQVIRGEMTLTYGYVTGPDGKKHSVAGVKVPWTAVPIKTGYVKGSGTSNEIAALQTAYKNDNGNGTYVVTGDITGEESYPCPSACDDVTTNGAGQGGVWKQLTVGYQPRSREEVLLRWIAYDMFEGGHGSGVSAMYKADADFGGYFTFDSIRFPDFSKSYKITFDISDANAAVDDGSLYFASQIRQPDPIYFMGFIIGDTGEGDLNPDFWTVFSLNGATVGNSAEGFWFDYDPLDGIYDEMEYDNFGPDHPGANLLVQIDVGGSLQQLHPATVSRYHGRYISGDVLSVYDTDNEFYVIDNFDPSGDFIYPIGVEMQTLSPSTAITGLRLTWHAKMQFSGFSQKISLFNYDFSRWDVVYTGPITNSVVQFDKLMNSAKAKEYVRKTGTKLMKARVEIREEVLNHPRLWRLSLDDFSWIVTKP